MTTGTGIVEGLPNQLGLATGARLKGDSGVGDMSRPALAFADTGHMERIATGRACVLGKQNPKVKIPHLFFIGIDIFENAVDLMDQGITDLGVVKRRDPR